jgi:hypothetical protein
MQRGSRMTSAGLWADPAKTGQLEDLVAQLVLVGMCAMLGCARSTPSGPTYRVLEALDPRATTLDLAPGDLEGLSPAHRQQLPPVRQTGHASSGQSSEPQ